MNKRTLYKQGDLQLDVDMSDKGKIFVIRKGSKGNLWESKCFNKVSMKNYKDAANKYNELARIHGKAIDRVEPLPNLWYEDEDGGKYIPTNKEMEEAYDVQDKAKDFPYQHLLMPILQESIVSKDGEIMSGETTINCITPIIIYLVQERGWDLVDSITLGASTCERCLNILLEETTGEPYDGRDKAGTYCELCAIIDPEYAKQYKEAHPEDYEKAACKVCPSERKEEIKKKVTAYLDLFSDKFKTAQVRPPKPLSPPAAGYKWMFDEASNVWMQVPEETETVEVKPAALSKRDVEIKSRQKKQAIDFKRASDIEWKAYIETYIKEFKRMQEKIQGIAPDIEWPYAQESFEELIDLVLPEDVRSDRTIIEKIMRMYKNLGHDVEITTRLEELTEYAPPVLEELEKERKEQWRLEQEGETLEDALQRAIAEEDYEEAAKIREQIEELRKLLESKKKFLSKRDIKGNWPSIDRAVDIGLKPRFYVSPAGTYPGRQSGDTFEESAGQLVQIANEYGAEYSQGVQLMSQVARRGWNLDKALDYAIENTSDLNEDDKPRLLEVYRKFFK